MLKTLRVKILSIMVFCHSLCYGLDDDGLRLWVANIFNITDFEYGYNFLAQNNKISNLSKFFPPHHIAVDLGVFMMPDYKFEWAYGLKLRYEYEFGENVNGVHRLGGEFYIHPPIFFRDFQYASLYLGVGGRYGNPTLSGGTYVDVGAIIMPLTDYVPLHIVLNYRADFIPNAPMQHGFRMSIRVFTFTPILLPFAGSVATND